MGREGSRASVQSHTASGCPGEAHSGGATGGGTRTCRDPSRRGGVVPPTVEDFYNRLESRAEQNTNVLEVLQMLETPEDSTDDSKAESCCSVNGLLEILEEKVEETKEKVQEVQGAGETATCWMYIAVIGWVVWKVATKTWNNMRMFAGLPPLTFSSEDEKPTVPAPQKPTPSRSSLQRCDYPPGHPFYMEKRDPMRVECRSLESSTEKSRYSICVFAIHLLHMPRLYANIVPTTTIRKPTTGRWNSCNKEGGALDSRNSECTRRAM